MSEKTCTPIPCPPFGEVELEVLAVCDCFGRLLPGDPYAPGCPVHDPTETDEP
jgi:hypothetical protein